MLGTLVLVALAAGVYFSDKQKAAEASKPPTDAPPKILALPDGDITKIAATNAGNAFREKQYTRRGHTR